MSIKNKLKKPWIKTIFFRLLSDRTERIALRIISQNNQIFFANYLYITLITKKYHVSNFILNDAHEARNIQNFVKF